MSKYWVGGSLPLRKAQLKSKLTASVPSSWTRMIFMRRVAVRLGVAANTSLKCTPFFIHHAPP